MELQLDKELLRQKIDERFDGRAAHLATALGTSRSTVTRWAADGLHRPLPRTAETVLAMAEALGVDPTVLWHWIPEQFPRVIARVLRTARARGWGQFLPALSFLQDLLLPGEEWPPGEIAASLRRTWHTETAREELRRLRNRYVAFVVDVDALPPAGHGPDPQVWYAARRATTTAHTDWFDVQGFVVRRKNSIALFSLSGLVMERPLPVGARTFAIEVWLGEAPSELKLVSLHPFAARIVTEVPDDMTVVRFCERPQECADGEGTRCRFHEACASHAVLHLEKVPA